MGDDDVASVKRDAASLARRDGNIADCAEHLRIERGLFLFPPPQYVTLIPPFVKY